MSFAEAGADFGSSLPTSIGYLTSDDAVVGSSRSGTDVDSYKVYLEAGARYFFYVDGFSSYSNNNAYLTLHTASGSLVATSTDSFGSQTLSLSISTSGYYDVRVRAGGSTGDYYLTYKNTANDDYAGNFVNASNVTIGSPVTGQLEFAGDSDGFRLTLNSGTRYYYEYNTNVSDFRFDVTGLLGRRVAVNDVFSGETGGAFTVNSSVDSMFLLSSTSLTGTGSYSFYVSPTYSNTANFILGDNFDNALSGTGGSDEIRGSWGADTLSAGAGDDYLFGGPGDYADLLNGGRGADLMIGGGGNDVYIVDNVFDRVYESSKPLSGGPKGGLDLVKAGVSFTLGFYIENLTLTGSAEISGTGNAAANLLQGNASANLLSGRAGDDKLRGQGGDDTLVGGGGADHLTGGSGADVFVFGALDSSPTSADVITDFSSLELDKIDLSGIDGNVATAGRDSFTFLGVRPFDADATGELRFVFDINTGKGALLGSVDADPDPEIVVYLTGVSELTGRDLVV
jgi:Ca2+-binding RTX toxin-like protein